MSILGSRRILGPISIEMGGDPNPSSSAGGGAGGVIISPNVSGNFLTATGIENNISSLTPSAVAAILGGGSVGSISLRSNNGDYYSVGVTDGGILTAISQSHATNNIVLKAADGSHYTMTVSDGGILTLTSGSC